MKKVMPNFELGAFYYRFFTIPIVKRFFFNLIRFRF
jgi:hypothetical protein